MRNIINEASNGKLSGLTPISTGGGTHKLNAEAAAAYEKMVQAAKNENITWGITDSYRDYETQDRIFDWDFFRKKGKKRKKGTSGTPAAYPGTSNHGWGSAVDLKVDYGDAAHTWLTKNASKFGFSNPFSDPKTEPWHWEHLQSAKNMGANVNVNTSNQNGDLTTPTTPTTPSTDSSDETKSYSDIEDRLKSTFKSSDDKMFSKPITEEINRIKNLMI